MWEINRVVTMMKLVELYSISRHRTMPCFASGISSGPRVRPHHGLSVVGCHSQLTSKRHSLYFRSS